MLIKYKNKMITLRELCIELKINYDNFMSWCHEHALQNYQTALNYYKRTLKHGKKQARITVQPETPLDAKRTILGIGLGIPSRRKATF